MSDPLNQNSLTPENFGRIREVFESALERPPEERQAFVENACAGDKLLIEEVKRMLAAEGQPDQLLDRAEPVSPARGRTNVCPSCKADIAVSDSFCRSCGTPVDSVSRTEGRFRTGALFANRFRIVGLLGRGGMGEVYRAHDLALDQPVALKFLTAVRFDERARGRLRNEVRLARQVSHANVCRVYDIGEAEGEHYLSMEYVDGEDLAVLLRRIGKLPMDKAVEIALKLCAGLAAAHSKGMLHRDLKPANIMIDSFGEVRIMDFGLAAISEELRATQVSEGTPYYMAPEQLAGEKASVQSDMYALGLVFYEMLTGKPPFAGNTPAELRRLREESRITPPSMFVSGIEPTVERAILRCLEADPKMRPASAHAVAALLPGGDPLAKALAAGETPSPEMIAAAGSTEPVRSAVAILLLASIAVGVAALCVIAPKVQLLSWLSLENPPEVLIARAREIANQFGYKERPGDWAWGFRFDEGYFRYMQTKASDDEQWRKALSLPPPPLSFWYRQSQAPLRATLGRQPLGPRVEERVLPDDPLRAPGMLSVDMDLEGRLLRFSADSPSTDASTVSADEGQSPDWPGLYAAARLDPAHLSPITPSSTPRVTTDAQAAWIGSYSERPGILLRIEAASYRGRIVSFEIAAPWTGAGSLPAESLLSLTLWELMGLAMVLATTLFAYRNWKTGRADISGALRVGLFFFVYTLLVWGLASHHPSAPLALQGLGRAWRLAISEAVNMFALYLAVEQWGRRLWPRSMITWSRVLTGRWRDPQVGRDVLIGLLVGVGICLLLRLREFDIIRLGGPPSVFSGIPNTENVFLYHLMGPFSAMTGMLQALGGFGGALVVTAFLLVGRTLLRNKWLPAALLLLVGDLSPFHVHWTTALLGLLASLLMVWTIYRFGVFVFGVTQFGISVMMAILTADFTMWYGASSVAAVIVVSGIALLGFRLAVLGQPLWRPATFEKLPN